MTVSPYTGEPDGAMILAVSRGICPPRYPGVPTHTCDEAAQYSMTLVAWWNATDLLDADGHCRFCGERV